LRWWAGVFMRCLVQAQAERQSALVQNQAPRALGPVNR
jgi:hypothetical protein